MSAIQKSESQDSLITRDELFLTTTNLCPAEQKNESRTTTIEKTVVLSSLILATLSTYIYYPLGKGFGGHFCTWFNITGQAANIVKIAFGVNTIIAVIALSLKSSWDASKTIISLASKKIDKENHVPSNLKKKIVLVSAFVFGLFFIIPRFYLTVKYVAEFPIGLKILLIPPAFIAPYAIGIISMKNFATKIFQKFTNNTYFSDLNELTAYMKDKVKCSDEFVNELYEEQSSFLNLKTAIRKASDLKATNPTIGAHHVNHFSKKMFSGYVGFAFGALANYAFVAIVFEAGKAFSKFVHISAYSHIINIFVLSTYLVASISLRGPSAQNRFENLYSLFSKKLLHQYSFKKAVITLISIAQGFFAALPATYLAIESAQNRPWYLKALIVPSFIAPFSIYSHSSEQLIKRVLKAWNETKTKNNHSVNKREKLIEILTKKTKSMSLMTTNEVKNMIRHQEETQSLVV